MTFQSHQGIQRTATAALIVGLACGAVIESHAQTLEEIVVTARRVEERLQDIPLSITVFDSRTIEAAGITNLGDVAELTPGLSFFNPFGENLPVPVIRGVAPTDIFGQQSAAIFIDGVYASARRSINFSQLDLERIEILKGPQSAQYGRTALAGAINYITKLPSEEFESTVTGEVGNRGKQKGIVSVGGPIMGPTLRGRVSMLYDEWDGSYNNTEAPQNNIGGYRFRSYQGSLLWEPLDAVRIRLGLYHSNDEIDEAAVASLPTNCEPRTPPVENTPADAQRLLDFCGKVPKLADLPGDVTKNSMPKIAEATGEERTLSRFTLNVDWTTDIGTFSSLTGGSRTRQESRSDFSRSLGNDLPFVYCPSASPASTGVREPYGCLTSERQRFFSGVLNLENGDVIKEFSQEIRFASRRDQPLRFLVGGIWYDEDRQGYPGGTIGTAPVPPGDIGIGPWATNAPNLAIGSAIFWDTFYRDDGGLDPLRRVSFQQEASGWGLFTSVDYDLTDRLTARGELRMSHEVRGQGTLLFARCEALAGESPAQAAARCGDEKWDLTQRDALPTDPDNPGDGSEFGRARFNALSGRLGLDFRINEDWMVYGSIAKGDKPGGVQVINPALLPDAGQQLGDERERIVNAFKPEKLWAYEIGVKGRTQDGRLGVDLAVYYYDWTDIVLRQLVDRSPNTGRILEQPTAFNVNAGDASVWGWELSSDASLTDNLTARLTVSYTDSGLDSAAQDTFEFYPSFAPDGDVSGNKLLRQPQWTSSFTLSYGRELANGLRFSARTDVTYQDSIFVGNDNQSQLPSHTYVNGRIGLRSSRYSVELWVRNLFEDKSAIAAFRDIYWTNTQDIYAPYSNPPTSSFADFPPLRYTVTYPNLRTYGLTARVFFGGAVR